MKRPLIISKLSCITFCSIKASCLPKCNGQMPNQLKSSIIYTISFSTKSRAFINYSPLDGSEDSINGNTKYIELSRVADGQEVKLRAKRKWLTRETQCCTLKSAYCKI